MSLNLERSLFRLVNDFGIEIYFQHLSHFDEIGRKFPKWLENAMGKGEIPRNEQFLLFPQCFLKSYAADT